MALGRRLDAAIREPMAIRGAELRLTASIGIALGRDAPETLLAEADAAVYRAKTGGRGRIELGR